MNNLHNSLTFQNSQTSHPTTRRRSHVVTTSLCTSQQGRRYVSNETPNDFLKELHQDLSVVRLHDILFKRRNDVSRGRNNYVQSVRLLDVSDNSQMKHPTTSQWYDTKSLSGAKNIIELSSLTSLVVLILDVQLVPLYDVSCKSQMKDSVTSL